MKIFACTLQETPDTSKRGIITIAAETVQERVAANAAETKTVMYGEETRWVADSDRIGIFSPQAKPTSDGSAPTNNAAFTALNSAKTPIFPDLFTGK